MPNELKRWDVINWYLSKAPSPTAYLEIGVRGGRCFRRVKADLKVGVDPDPKSVATIKCTSDEFFEKNRDELFDVVFIDGLHRSEQVRRDIDGAMERMRVGGGVIVVHDCNPLKEEHQWDEPIEKTWNGDVWKEWVDRRRTYLHFESFTIDTDHGLGVMKVEAAKRIEWRNCQTDSSRYSILKGAKTWRTWEGLVNNRRDWLNLITVEEWERTVGKGRSTE